MQDPEQLENALEPGAPLHRPDPLGHALARTTMEGETAHRPLEQLPDLEPLLGVQELVPQHDVAEIDHRPLRAKRASALETGVVAARSAHERATASGPPS